MSSWNQIIPVLSGLALEEFISGHALSIGYATHTVLVPHICATDVTDTLKG